MIILELLMILILVGLCIYASASDIKTGLIANKVLAVFAACAAVADSVYYSVFVPNLIISFLINVSVIMVLSVLLFITHSWAGGDCKLLCVFALLYPGRLYVDYFGIVYTLVFTICAAFIVGYLYLIIDTLHDIIKKKISISVSSILKKLIKFFASYLTALVYIAAIHMLYTSVVTRFLHINGTALSAIYIAICLLSKRVAFFKKKLLIGFVLLFDVVLSIIMKTVPIGTDYKTYAIIFLTAVIGAVISSNNYEVIPTSSVKKGTILSTATTMLFTQSKVKDLPGISTEDLKSRLTEDEAASVIVWEKTKFGQPTVSIVRKIPFAIFISVGFIAYLILWGVL